MTTTAKKLYENMPVIVNPSEKVVSYATYSASGGSLDSNYYYYFKLAWVTASGETLVNTGYYGSLNPGTGYRYTITVPTFPAGVTSVNIYAAKFYYTANPSVYDIETATYYLQGNSTTTSFIFGAELTATTQPKVDTSGLYDTVAYTVPANTKTIVKSITLCNTSKNKSATASLAIRPSGTAKGLVLANRILSEYTVQPSDTIVIDLSLVMETGEAILMSQAVAAGETANELRIAAHISGVEVV